MKFFKIIFILIWFSFSISYAANFQKGLNAARSGNFSTALKELMPLAENGEAIAQHMIGQMHIYGHGVKQDTNKAIKWFILAAEQGNISSQSILGYIYTNGEKNIKDENKAVKWYRLAAEQGDPLAQNNLGLKYL